MHVEKMFIPIRLVCRDLFMASACGINNTNDGLIESEPGVGAELTAY